MYARLVALLKNDVSPWIDDGGISAVGQAVSICSDTVDADHVTLVFNGSGLQEGFPVC